MKNAPPLRLERGCCHLDATIERKTAHFSIGNGQLRFCRLVRDIGQHILHAAGKNAAKVIERRGGDIAVVLERVQCTAAECVVFDQGVGRDAPLLHCLP